MIRNTIETHNTEEQNMNILYDHTVFQNQRYGGISRYFCEIISRISIKANTNVNLFQGLHVNKYDLKYDLPLQDKYEHLFDRTNKSYASYFGIKPNLPLSPFIKSHMFAYPNKVLFDMFYRTRKFDIYHPTYYFQDIERYHKTPIVLTVHDMIHELYPNKLSYSKHTIGAKEASINAADKIICISNNTKKDLMKIYDVPEDKIEIIYLASSLKKFDGLVDTSRFYGINKPYLLYVGDRNGVYKNFSTLLEAFTSSLKNDYDLVCFGGGPFNKNELSIIDKANCGDKVTQLSGSDITLTSLYQNAFAFVCPSHYEGFGLPLLEAMSCGCPVIAANTSSIPEVVGDAAVLFDPNYKEDLIEAVESLDETKRNSLINAGFEQEKLFSWDKTASETLKVYKEVAE